MDLIIDKKHPCNPKIYNKGINKVNKYIVIHFTGDSNVKAENYAICNQYNNAKRDASWHYCVGNSKENFKIYQSVEDNDIAWHCGGKNYTHQYCRNNNSIGIEHCCYWKDGKAYFEDGTIEASVKLVVSLMKKYKIPIENVLMHYHVTGKMCPMPFLYGDNKWEDYLARIKQALNEPEYKLKTININLFGKNETIQSFKKDNKTYVKLRGLQTSKILEVGYNDKPTINGKVFDEDMIKIDGSNYTYIRNIQKYGFDVQYDEKTKKIYVNKKDID